MILWTATRKLSSRTTQISRLSRWSGQDDRHKTPIVSDHPSKQSKYLSNPPTPQPPKRSTSSPVRRGVRVVILASDVGSLKTRFGHSLDPHWSGWLGLLSPTFQVSDCTLVLTQAEMSGIQVSDIVREGGESGEGERRTTGWRGVFGPLLDGLREG